MAMVAGSSREAEAVEVQAASTTPSQDPIADVASDSCCSSSKEILNLLDAARSRIDQDKYAERLEECHLSDESLEIMDQAWTKAQRDALNRRRENVEYAEVPAQMRIAANVFMWRMTMSVKAPPMRLFEAEQLFELRNKRSVSMAPHDIMARAAAAWLMCYKFSEVHSDPMNFIYNSPLRLLAVTASKASVCLGGQEVTEDMIKAEERKTMAEDAEFVSLANVLTWLQVFVGRLDIVTEGVLTRKLGEAMTWAEKMLTTCICYGTPPTQGSTPREWATGILAMSLVACGLLPWAVVGGEVHDGYTAMAAVCSENGQPKPSPQGVALLLTALEFAAASTFRDIRFGVALMVQVERQYQTFIHRYQQSAAA